MNKCGKLDTLVKELKDLGCTSVQDASLCAFTYLELQRRKDAELVDQISYHYNSHINKLYCQALTLETGRIYIYVPISSSSSLDHQTWEDYFSLIPKESGLNSLILAIWEPESTHVFYEVTKGLGSPSREKEREEFKGEQKSKKLEHSEIPSTSQSKRKYDEL